jgi:hypothetical protein
MNRQKEPKLRVRGETNPTRSLDSVENRTGTSKRKETPPLALLPAKSVDTIGLPRPRDELDRALEECST